MRMSEGWKLYGLSLLLTIGLGGCGGSGDSPSASRAGQTSASSTALAETVVETWTKCANENGTCTFSGTTQVRYGLNSTWATLTATGSIGCNNNVFGDPLPGADKICEYLTTTTTTTPPPPPPPPPPTDVTWTKCANENGICTFTGTRDVRYGLNGTWATRTATDSIACNNNVFGDPLPGADKICEYASTTTTEPPPPPPPPPPTDVTWTKCADENGVCTFSGTRDVRYGLNGTWATRTATGSIACNNNVFGDPLPGADKICEYASTTTTEPPPPPPPPPPSGDCNGIIDQCFDFTAPKVAKYKGNKVAAASYTFDDGYPSSAKIATIFEGRGLRATFYIIANTADYAGWPLWQSLAGKGHEIGNHSLTHTIDMSDPTLPDSTLFTEINDAQTVIEQHVGVKPLTFAFPWHAYTAHAMSIAEQSHYAVRKVAMDDPTYRWAFFDQDHTPTLAEALKNANDTLSETVAIGGWMVAGGHGVDGDGWSPVTSQFLIDHLTFASQYSSKLWIDTLLNVSRYRQCRPQVTPVVTVASSTQATVRLDGTATPGLCSAPLTVTIPVKASLSGQVQARTTTGTTVPTTISGGVLMFDVVPGQQVVLTTTTN